MVWHCKSTNHSTLFHCLHGWLHTLRVRHLIILNTSSTKRNKNIKTLGDSSSIWLLSKSLKWGNVLDLGWTVADITTCKRSYSFNGTFFEVATNTADARASIFGEFEHVNNLCTCLLLSLGASLYNNRFVLYTIIDIIIRCDTITQ